MAEPSETTDPSSWTLAASAARHAHRRAEHCAISCENRRISYLQFHQVSNQLAHALRDSGIGLGNRIAYLGKESEHYYFALLACAKVGAVLVPVNWRLTPREVDHILRDSGAELLMYDEEFRPLAQGVAADLPSLRALVCIDLEEGRAEPDADHGQGLRAWSAGRDTADLTEVTGPDDPVVQIYTSGTSGLPKGVVLANRSFFTLPASMRAAGVAWIDWQAEDVQLIALPGLGIAGIGWFMHGFNAGATNVIMRMFEPREAVRLVQQHKVSTTFAAPAMLQLMLAERGVDQQTFASFRKIAYGAAPISEALLGQCIEVFGCELVQIYSSTEAGSVAVCLPPAEHYPGNPLLRAAGRACPGNELMVVDEAGEPVASGQIGQVCIRTPARMLEYWQQPEATTRTVRDGWLHMGDLGYLDDDGYLFLCDRISDTIIVAGQNIYPAEVERQLSEHPEVRDVAVVAVPDPRWGDAVHARVVLTAGARATPRQLSLFLRGRLADYKIPTGYSFAQRLPRNPSGKILRRQVRAELLADPQPPVGAAVASTRGVPMSEPRPPRFGVLLPTREQAINRSFAGEPLLRFAQQAELLGFDSLWTGDSLLARPRLDPLVVLAAAAGVTSRIALGTAAITPALRHPLIAANMITSLDHVSSGRLLLGVGSGFPMPETEREFAAVGASFTHRAGRLDDTVRLWRQAWASGRPDGSAEYRGRYLQAGALDQLPDPARPGGPPLWLAGSDTPQVLRRVARHYDGWLPFLPTAEAYGSAWNQLQAELAGLGRPTGSVTAGMYATITVNPDRAAAHAELEHYVEHYYGRSLDQMAQIQAYGWGTAEECADWLAGYLRAGASHLVIRIGSLDPEPQLKDIASIVLPALRSVR